MDAKELKCMTLDDAVRHVKDGMTIGIGSGSTIELLIPKLAALHEQGVAFTGVCTSKKTAMLAQEANIPVVDVNHVTHIDLAIDGADEVDPQLNLIKGGGGALFREKVIDAFADYFIVIADESKVVNYLGETFKLPVEVDTFNWLQVKQIIAEKTPLKPELRLRDDVPLITDNGNYILDCTIPEPLDVYALHETLIHIVGVLETGLFLDVVDKAIIGTQQGVRIMETDRVS